MKIVYVVPLLAPYAITRFQELGKNEDVELHVIVEKDTFEERNGWKYQEIEGVHTYLLNGQVHSYSVEHKKSGYAIDNAHMYSKGLRRLVNSINPDICIVCNSTQLLSLLEPRKYKVGVVVEDTLRAEEGRRKLNRLVKRLLLKSADIYFPYSTDAMEFLRKNGIKKNCYPSSWSIGESFFEKKNNDINNLKKYFQLQSSKRVYTIVSALIPRKGIKQFIEAWKEMPEKFLNHNELHVVGDGPLEGELKYCVKEYGLEKSIIFRGNLPYKDVADFLSCTDVFVLPTLEDLCSLAIFEAVASGLPVMTTIYNGARDLVHEGVNGFVFNPENKNSIIDALRKMDKADLHTMSVASKEISRKYTNEQVMLEFYQTLKRVI